MGNDPAPSDGDDELGAGKKSPYKKAPQNRGHHKKGHQKKGRPKFEWATTPKDPKVISYPKPEKRGGGTRGGQLPTPRVGDRPEDPSVLLTIGRVGGAVAEGASFPLLLLLIALLFLAIQDRIDRRDPKLALAPVHPDSHLDFQPRNLQPGD